jgi:hypothetical protein
MTRKGYNAFVKAISGIWAVIIGFITFLVCLIIYGP